MKQLLSGNDWIVSHFLPCEATPASGVIQRVSKGERYGASFIPATVPGDVQSDALDAHLIEDIDYGFQARNAEWTYQRDWLYVKEFVPENTPHRKAELCFEGVDYECQVFLNGTWLGDHKIAWIPFRFDVTDILIPEQKNTLLVLVKAAPDAQCQWGKTASVDHLKARFAYGWDWCTRLVPLGIWKDVYLHYEQSAVIRDLHVVTDVDYRNRKAHICVKAAVDSDGSAYDAVFTLTHPNKETECVSVVATGNEVQAEFDIADAALWYPNGMGEHPLYEMSLVLGDNWDARQTRFGLRHIEWTQTAGASADALAYQPYVNGRRVYLQGYNFTPIRQLYGRVHADIYRKRVLIAQRSGANYLRVWGGGLLEREEFYDACDEMGIMLMQELFQSSANANNHPSRSEEYIQMMLEVTESAILQKRNHPSLILWCGGNELCFRGNYMDAAGNILIEGVEGNEGYVYDVSGCDWVPLSPEYPTLKRMQEVVNRLDPSRHWLHTSGSGPFTQNGNLDYVGGGLHDVHGPWYVFGPTDQYTWYNALDMMVHHEFGCPSCASVQILEAVIPPQYLWPIDETNPMTNFRGRMYLYVLPQCRLYFGNIDDHRTFSQCSRFLQWEQIRYSLEAHRRLGAGCACSCLWHYAEPWPNMLDNCSLDAYEQVKPAYYGEKAAFRPVHIAARYTSVIHKDAFDVEISLHNATTADVSGTILVQLYDLNGALMEQKQFAGFVPADTDVACAAKMTFTALPDGPFFLRQSFLGEDDAVLASGYSIHSTHDVPYETLLSQPDCEIEAVLEGNALHLTNKGTCVVSGLTVECANEGSVLFSDGCIMLLPGESATIDLELLDGKLAPMFLTGFGVPYQPLTLKK